MISAAIVAFCWAGVVDMVDDGICVVKVGGIMCKDSVIVTAVDDENDVCGLCGIGKIEWSILKTCRTGCVCSAVMRV